MGIRTILARLEVARSGEEVRFDPGSVRVVCAGAGPKKLRPSHCVIMAALAEVVAQVMENEKHGDSEDTHSSPIQRLKLANAAPRRSSAGYTSTPGSPAARTGPPNS